MDAYAVIMTGGKQYWVQPGATFSVERLTAETGKPVEFDSVLAISDGTKLRVGNPTVAGAIVTATVVKHLRGTKLVHFKKRRRKGYARKMGHRQELTQVKIEALQ